MLAKLDEPAVVVSVSLAAAVACLIRRRPEAAVAIGGAAPLAVGVCNILKHTVREHRPRLFDKHPEQSFPSSHAAGVGALSLALVANTGAWWALPIGFGAKLAVDCARVVRREHWPHDVFWGDLIGIGAAVAAAGAARAIRSWRAARRRQRATMRA